jgi:putative ABC transport system permease protein
MVKTELLKYPQITGAALKDCLPTGSRNNTSGVYWQGKNQSHNNIYMETTRVSFDYFKTMDMEMAAGRDFSREFSTDVSDAFILNETAVKVAGIQDPVGKMFQLYQKKGVIIGVVKDTYFKTMKRALNPQVYYLFTDIPKEAYFGSLFIRIKKTKDFGQLSEVLKYIENTWNKVNSVTPFEYYFLDETIDDLYKNERRLGRVFTYFAFLAIFISCLGLFGLSSFLVEKRTKEIGIRKTLGASVKYLVIMLSKDFSKWVLLSNMIAIPLAWYAMKQWLQNFAYQTGIGIWIFILSGSAALIIAFLTVVFQSLKAANTNPIDALRYE